MVKGYGDTHAQGEKNYEAIMDALPAFRGKRDAAQRLKKLREAALADDTGEKLAHALADEGANEPPHRSMARSMTRSMVRYDRPIVAIRFLSPNRNIRNIRIPFMLL